MNFKSEKPDTPPSRRGNRLAATQFLYMWELNPNKNIEASLTQFFAISLKKKRGHYQFAEELIIGTVQQLERIDECIKKYSRNWAFSRIAKTDLAILRLAIYEFLYRKDIPPVVSINEAIELTKFFSNIDSKRFINGILDKVKETLDRPLRSANKPQN